MEMPATSEILYQTNTHTHTHTERERGGVMYMLWIVAQLRLVSHQEQTDPGDREEGD